MKETKVTTCIGGCMTGFCGVRVHIEDGRITKVEGYKDHPISRGFTCKKGRTEMFQQYHEHPSRLNYPLKRIGKRGENKWQQVTWEQALDEIAEKLKKIKEKYGAETLALATGTAYTDQYWAGARFLNLFGSPNHILPGEVCYCDSIVVETATYGFPCIARAVSPECKVVVSGSRQVSFPRGLRDLVEAKKRGCRIIVLDPKFTTFAKMADVWLQLRPGTDGAILLSWLNIIINGKLYDKDFVEKWTNAPFLVRLDTGRLLRENEVIARGKEEKFMVWDEMTKKPQAYDPESRQYEPKTTKPALTGAYKVSLAREREVECKTVWQVLTERVAQYPPEEVEKITWVPSAKIIESARMYATNEHGSFNWYVAPSHFGRNNSQYQHAKCILRAITGNIDVEGGDILTGPPKWVTFAQLELYEKLPEEQRKKQLGAEFPLMSFPGWDLMAPHVKRVFGVPHSPFVTAKAKAPQLFRAMLNGKPYPVRALITMASTCILGYANSKLVYEALKSLDLLVVLDHFMTPTGMLADYVFPITGPIERPICTTPGTGDSSNVIFGSERVIKPPYERRDDYQFWCGLGGRLGQEEYWPWQTLEDVNDYRLKPLGMTFADFAKKPWILPPPTYKRYEKYGFATPSGKVEIYSSIFERLGADPIPFYEEAPESPVSTPELAKEYPLILTTGRRFEEALHSNFRHLPVLREAHPDPLAEIHPETAAALDPPISDGDWIWIETPRGKAKFKASVTPDIAPKVVQAEHAWWFPETRGEEPELFGLWESNINVCTSDNPEHCDKLIGGWYYRGMLCKVYKV